VLGTAPLPLATEGRSPPPARHRFSACRTLTAAHSAAQALRSAPEKRGPPVVRVRHRRLPGELDCDVAVCGGTLGLFLALALQLRGHRVTIVERRRVEGRAQEWNVSRPELNVRAPPGRGRPGAPAPESLCLVLQRPALRCAHFGAAHGAAHGADAPGV